MWFLFARVKNITSKNKRLVHIKFLQDIHWYAALLLALIFWFLYGLVINPLHINNVFEPLNIILFSIILYPIVEEIVFRGLIQEYFNKQDVFKRKVFFATLSNIATSGLFALSHLLNQELLWALLTFFPSLIFGYFKDRHHSLLPSISLHIIYNFGFFTLIA